MIVPAVVTVSEPVKENLDPLLLPAPQLGCKRRAWNDRRTSPMVWNNKHCKAAADVGEKQAYQPIYLTFEARRDVVNGSEQESAIGR